MEGTAILILMFMLLHGVVDKTRNKKDPPIFDHGIGLKSQRPLVVGHRGSSGIYPDHTVAAYKRAIEDGADMIECDLTITKDLKLVCRHDIWLDDCTDVASKDKFANKRNVYFHEGRNITKWFVFDFTLAELLELRAIQPLSFRDPSYNNKFTISTFDEFVTVAKSSDRKVGIYVEIKEPRFINSIPGLLPNGSRIEDLVIRELFLKGYSSKMDGCILQSYDEESLLYVKEKLKSPIPLVICLEDVDEYVPNSDLDRFTKQGFYGVCYWKDLIYRSFKDGTYKNKIYKTSDFIERSQSFSLKVHLFTFRNEDRYLSWDYHQDIRNEYDMFFKHNVDAYFTDFPQTLARYLDDIYA